MNPASLAFIAVGTAAAQTVTVSEANYGGTFSATTTTCGGVATIAAANTTTLTVTPIAAGHCTFAISGAAGQSATLTIDITTTSVGGS